MGLCVDQPGRRGGDEVGPGRYCSRRAGLNPPPPKTAPKRTTTQAAARKSAHPAPPPPAPLLDEEFRVFELAYGSGATLVLTAHTGGPFAQQKFVTLIAQPDLYGNLLVLLKNVTDGAHLDDTRA